MPGNAPPPPRLHPPLFQAPRYPESFFRSTAFTPSKKKRRYVKSETNSPKPPQYATRPSLPLPAPESASKIMPDADHPFQPPAGLHPARKPELMTSRTPQRRIRSPLNCQPRLTRPTDRTAKRMATQRSTTRSSTAECRTPRVRLPADRRSADESRQRSSRAKSSRRPS